MEARLEGVERPRATDVREPGVGAGRPGSGPSPLRWILVAAAALMAACGPGEGPGSAASGGGSGEGSVAEAEPRAGGRPGGGVEGRTSTGAAVVAGEEDWRIVREKVEWARSNGLDTVPVGHAVARLGTTFVGTPYIPRTLEVEGPERLVVNLRALDCVTFVETVLALVHVIRDGPPLASVGGRDGNAGTRRGEGAGRSGASDEASADEGLRRAYRRALTRIRYRDGVLDGYPSRLHYFSEWIRNAEAKGLVVDVTAELGGIEDPEPVNFMTEHPDAYRQLADSGVRAAVRRTEKRISRVPRAYLPEERIEAAAPAIRDGDVIAATSTVPGLDVAHTGIALWRDGRLHLLHAPLVGDSVQISGRTLARRIAEIESQDGILVARPVEPE